MFKLIFPTLGLFFFSLHNVAQAAPIVRKLAVVIVSFADLPNDITREKIKTRFIDKSNAVLNQYTYGNVSFDSDVNRDGTPDIFGPYVVTSLKRNDCPANTQFVMSETNALDRKFGASNYNHILYVLPAGACLSGWAVNGSYTTNTLHRAWNTDVIDDLNTDPKLAGFGFGMTHEAFHTLGLGHANSTASGVYADYSSIMGQNFYRLNAVQSGFLGAFPAMGSHFREIQSPVDEVITLHSLDLPKTSIPAGGLKVVRVSRENNPSAPLVLSYRSIDGYSDDWVIARYNSGVNIHTGSATSTELAVLNSESSQFVDEANKIMITQISKDATSVTFRITKQYVAPVAPAVPLLNLASKSETSSGGYYFVSLSTNPVVSGVIPTQFQVFRSSNGGPYTQVFTQNNGASYLSFQDYVVGASKYNYYVLALGSNGVASQQSNFISVDYSAYPAGSTSIRKGKR